MSTWRDVAYAWDRFWFTPADASTLGWMRILSGCMLVYTHAVWGLRLDAFFGPEGWQDPLLVQVVLERATSVSFWWHVPTEWMGTAHATALSILVLYVLGAGLRITAPLAFAIVISYSNRVPQANFGLDQINTLLTAYLALGYVFLPSRDARLSLDRIWYRFRSLWKSTRRGDLPPQVAAPQRQVAANIAARLVQVHMAIVYLYAGLGKLKGDAWWDGTAVWMAAANYEYQSGDLTWMAWYPYVPQFVTIFTVAWEVTFFLLVWRTRWQLWVLVCGVLMHLGIGAFLGMWTFGLIMIVTYVSFVPPEMVLRLQQGCDYLWWGDRPTTIGIDPSRWWTCLCGAWRGAWTPDRAQVWRIVASDDESSKLKRAIGEHVTVRLLPLVLGLSGLILSGCRPDGNSPQVWHARSRLLTSEDNADEALKALNTAISLQPTNADLFYDRAKLHELAERDKEAIADYERAIALLPTYSRAHHNRAFVLLRQEQIDDAIAGFTRAIQLAPKDSLAFRNRAVAHGRRGDLPSALADLDRAAELVPGSVMPWMLRGEICSQAQSLAEAERSYTTAIWLHPLFAPAWRGRSTVRQQLGQIDLADADARRAHEIEPALEAAPAIPESVSGETPLNNSVTETAAAPPSP